MQSPLDFLQEQNIDPTKYSPGKSKHPYNNAKQSNSLSAWFGILAILMVTGISFVYLNQNENSELERSSGRGGNHNWMEVFSKLEVYQPIDLETFKVEHVGEIVDVQVVDNFLRLAEKVKDLKVEFQLTLENHNGMVKELDTVKLEYERILNRLVLLKAQAKTHVEKIRDEKEKVSNRTEEIKKIIIEQAENDESIDRARNLLAEKSASLESLKNARISLDVQIKDLESREESKRVEIGQMERKIRQFDDFSSQNLKLVEKIASSESKKSELENSIQQNELEQKDEQAHLVQINQHLKALEKANSELNDIFKEDDNFAVIPESKDSISYIRDLIDRKIDSQVKSDLSDIFSKAENLLLEKEAKKQKVREYLDALKAENQDGKSNEVLDEIKQSIAQKEIEKKDHEATLDRLKSLHGKLSSELASLKDSISQLKRNQELNNEKLRDLETTKTRFQIANDELTRLQESKLRASTESTQLEKGILSSQDSVKQVKDQLNNLVQDRDSIKRKLESLETDRIRHQSALSNLMSSSDLSQLAEQHRLLLSAESHLSTLHKSLLLFRSQLHSQNQALISSLSELRQSQICS